MPCGSWRQGKRKMADEIEANAVDVELFQGVEGSQTSENGQGFALHARRLTFLHPIRYDRVTVEAPLSSHWTMLAPPSSP